MDLYPKQLMAFNCLAQEILFGGATRGGKSHFIRVMSAANCLEIPGLQVLIVRRLYEDVLYNHMEGPNSFKVMLKPLIDLKRVVLTENKVRFIHATAKRPDLPDSLITLSHCATDEAALKNQGIPKDILVFEEACQILERYIRFIRAWSTTTEEMKAKLPPRLRGNMPKIYYTANPIGASVGYFRRNFVHPAPMGTVFEAPEEDGGFTRCYIEARVEDNASEDTLATQKRVKGMGDEGYVEALLNANWDAPIGDFFKQYDNRIHCVPDHEPPDDVFKFRTFDWGSSDPFAVAWWYVSDGEEFWAEDSEGQSHRHWYPKGALIAYREWYGCDPNDCAKGLEMPNFEVAQGIVERTHERMSNLTITDAYPFMAKGSYKRGREYRIADEFAEHGVPLERANTQRVFGWKCVRDALIGKDGVPMLYFQQNCKYLRDYLPMIGRHKTKPEDAEESGEATHCSDIVRYACATNITTRDKHRPQPKMRRREAISVASLIKQAREGNHGRREGRRR
jgi:hypothetical protein